MERLIIVGTSTTAQTVAAFVLTHRLFDLAGFAVDRAYLTSDTFLDLPVYPLEELKEHIDPDKDLIFVAIAWNRLNADRRDVYLRLKKEGYRFANIISPTATIYGEIKGDNCWIGDNTVIQFYSVLRNNIILKDRAFVNHFCEINNHVYIGEDSNLAGGVTVGEQTFIGIRATIFDEVHIGRKCLVGGATVVKRHLPDFSKISNRADNYIIKNYRENEIESKLMHCKNIR